MCFLHIVVAPACILGMNVLLLILASAIAASDPLYDDFIDDPFEAVAGLPADHLDWDDTFDWDSDFDLGSLSYFNRTDDVASADLDPEGPCKADLLAHTECNYGKEKAVCLWVNAADAGRWTSRFGTSEWFRPISAECKAHLIDFLSDASAHPFEYFKDLRVQCAASIASLCTNTSREEPALACLRSNFDAVTDANCRDEISHLNSWTSLNATWWSPSLWQDCASERKAVCANFTSSGLSDFRDCLDDHRDALSDTCHRALFQSDLQGAPSPYLLRRDLGAKCKAQLTHYCSDVVRGDENQLFCLYRASKRHSSDFDPACAEQVTAVVKLLESDYRMNVPIRKFCKRTIGKFCAAEKTENDKSAHESDEVLSCLKRVLLFEADAMRGDDSVTGSVQEWHDYEETDACLHAVKQSVLVDSLDWEIDSSLHSNCFNDFHVLRQRENCQDPHVCLQTYFAEIKSADCREAVALHAQLSSVDEDFKPQLMTACALALDQLDCPDSTEPVDCLYEKVNTVSDGACRAAIKRDLDMADRDFRLSYELSRVCEKDRRQLCGSAEPSAVLQCMIDHVSEIADRECAKDVSRLSFVAENEGIAAVDKTACAADVEKFCKTTTTNVHSCLLTHIGELSDRCNAAVLNLHASPASQRAMELLLNSACSHVIASHCPEHMAADSQLQDKVACVREAEAEEYVPPECEAQVAGVERLLAADYRTNPALQQDCKMDVAHLCGGPAATLTTETVQCLVGKRSQVRNSKCKKQILSQILRMAQDVSFVPNAVCGDDLKRFCADVPPGAGRLHQCLRDNMEQLTHDCQVQEFTVEQLETLSESTRSACVSELESFCSSSSGALHCLWRNVDEASHGCQEAVRKEMRGKIGNIWLDPGLYAKCRLTVNSLITAAEPKCFSHLVQLPAPTHDMIPLPLNYTQAVAGEHIACLVHNRAKIADRSCSAAVETVLRADAQDPLLFRFGLRSACTKELAPAGICGKADPFSSADQWRCLQQTVRDKDAPVSSSCADSVKRMWRLAVVDIKFNPDVSANCEHEIAAFCKSTGGSRTLECLQARLNRTDSDISEECSEALNRMPPVERAIIPDVAAKDQNELPEMEEMRLLRQAGINSATGGIALTGPLAFVSLASLIVVLIAAIYKIIKLRLNKGYMVIVNKE